MNFTCETGIYLPNAVRNLMSVHVLLTQCSYACQYKQTVVRERQSFDQDTTSSRKESEPIYQKLKTK